MGGGEDPEEGWVLDYHAHGVWGKRVSRRGNTFDWGSKLLI